MVINTSSLPRALALHVVLRATEPQFVPAFLGSALHGTLGRALWKAVCAFPRRTQCRGCPLFARCAYPALFATPAPELQELKLGEFGVRDQAPRPIVLAPEPGWTRPSGHYWRLHAGAEIPFRVTLIGKAVDDLALLTVALGQMAESGIGRPYKEGCAGQRCPHRAGAELARITTGDRRETIFDRQTDLFQAPSQQGLEMGSSHCPSDGRVEIRLVSPLRLKRNGRFKGRPSPADFLVTLARRANTLAALFGSGSRVADEREIETLAEGIESESM